MGKVRDMAVATNLAVAKVVVQDQDLLWQKADQDLSAHQVGSKRLGGSRKER